MMILFDQGINEKASIANLIGPLNMIPLKFAS